MAGRGAGDRARPVLVRSPARREAPCSRPGTRVPISSWKDPYQHEHTTALDLHAALKSVEDSTRAPRMPPARLDVWLKTSPLLRRLIPTQPLIERAERRGRALWDRSPDERERAIAAMEAIVAGTARSAEVEELARAHLIERQVDMVLFWQPWSADAEEHSASLLRDALSAGRGVLLSACHQGQYYRSMYALPLARDSHYSVVGGVAVRAAQPRPLGAAGGALAQSDGRSARAGQRLLPAARGAARTRRVRIPLLRHAR